MPVHDNGLVTRHQLDHPATPVTQASPALETVLKYNPNHGADGRFASAGGGRRGGTAGPPTTGAFGQKLPKNVGNLRDRVAKIPAAKRLDYAVNRADKITDYYGNKTQTQEFRHGVTPVAKPQTMEFRHGVTAPAIAQTMEGRVTTPSGSMSAGRFTPLPYGAAGAATRGLPPMANQQRFDAARSLVNRYR